MSVYLVVFFDFSQANDKCFMLLATLEFFCMRSKSHNHFDISIQRVRFNQCCRFSIMYFDFFFALVNPNLMSSNLTLIHIKYSNVNIDVLFCKCYTFMLKLHALKTIDGWMDEWMHVCTDGWMNEWDGWMEEKEKSDIKCANNGFTVEYDRRRFVTVQHVKCIEPNQ